MSPPGEASRPDPAAWRSCAGTITHGASGAADALDEGGDGGVRVRVTRQQVARELRVLQVEQSLETLDFARFRGTRVTPEPALEQHVEFLHPTPTAPAQPTEVGHV